MPHDISFFLQHNKINNIENIHRIIIEAPRSKPREMHLLLRFKAFLERNIRMNQHLYQLSGFFMLFVLVSFFHLSFFSDSVLWSEGKKIRLISYDDGYEPDKGSKALFLNVSL